MSGLERIIAGAIVVLLLLATGQATAQQERIVAFASDVTVHSDGSLRVVETIDVMAAGDQIRRGIFRNFPTRSLTESGFNRLAGFDIVAIERDGKAEPYFLEQLGAGVRVYIGQSDVLLPQGTHRYTITYDTTRQLRHGIADDELYWNVTGDAWAFPIAEARVSVNLPAGASVDSATAYTGAYGATGRDFTVTARRGGTISLASTRPLAPGEGLTIAVAWPAGFVERPDETEELERLLLDNKGIVIGTALLALLLLYFLIAWSRVGRDPAKGVIFPRFEAPESLSPVAVGYIWNGGFADGFSVGRALTVAITSLAAKRYLVIEDDGEGHFTLSRRAGAPSRKSLPPGEKAVHRALFRKGEQSLSFGDGYVPAMGRASSGLLGAFDWEYGRTYFRSNSGPWFLGALLAIAAVLASVMIDAMGEETWLVAGVMAVFGSALLIVATVLLVTVMSRLWTAATIGTPYRPLASLGQLLGATAALLATALLGLVMSDMVAPAALPVAALPVPVAVAFWYLMKAPTRLGRQTLDAIEGYRLYLSVAEADRLNSAGREPPVTEALYENHLPFAMALGVEDEWTEKAMARLQADAEDPSRARRYQPDWYRGARHISGGRSLTGALTQGLGGAAAHAMVRPSSSSGSSFSGGGFSGGGGGGGGGGGW